MDVASGKDAAGVHVTHYCARKCSSWNNCAKSNNIRLRKPPLQLHGISFPHQCNCGKSFFKMSLLQQATAVYDLWFFGAFLFLILNFRALGGFGKFADFVLLLFVWGGTSAPVPRNYLPTNIWWNSQPRFCLRCPRGAVSRHPWVSPTLLPAPRPIPRQIISSLFFQTALENFPV